MTRAFARSDRIGQVERLLLASRVPLSQAEIARRCEVHRSTIGRLVQGMIDNGIPVRYTEDGLLYVERAAYISHLHLRLHEAMAVFLACRLLARYSDKPNSHTIEAIEKLGLSLQAVMPVLGGHITTTSAVLRSRLPKQAGDFQRVLEKLTEAWATGVKVRLWYRSLRAQRVFQQTFSPYFLEPSAIGYSTYAIGLAEPPGQLRTRKLERIERVELTSEPFTVPGGFNPNELLAGAWGIWFDAEDRPTTVRLRFAAGQASRRMQESLWHPSQRTEVDNEGRLLWTAEIDEPQEMLPWIRGWGADCEVLEPQELRERVIGDLRRQNALYQIEPPRDTGAELYAHTPAPGTAEWHRLIDHLVGVAELARSFAEPFGAGELAYQLGLWHDVGKANPAFQAYLRRCHTDPTQKGTGPDHKAAGTLLAQEYMAPLMLLIHGHHGGLRDGVTLKTWLAEQQKGSQPGSNGQTLRAAIQRVRELLPAIEPRVPLVPPAHLRDPLGAEFFLRMLFSALVDADFLDTEQHLDPRRAAARPAAVALNDLWEVFERDQQRLTGLRQDHVGQARHTLYQHCLTAASQPPGLFSLAIPTGGGKTRSAMAFALRHALQHNLRRVVVAVPYISITEQTAAVYRELFEADGERQIVLEHHSGVVGRTEAIEYDPRERWQRLASENWDAPIIVTTTVQLFESLFANQTGRCRKLHRLARSVIILDEVQALPPHLLRPILDGLRELCAHYGATVVLSTATQPAFTGIRELADVPAYPIVPDAERWFTALKRVDYVWQHRQALNWHEVADQLRGASQALAVVNTKGDALSLLGALGDPDALHLSTLLCGAHRRAVIADVKQRLAAGQPCRLVSTQVIEAGVDLDFPLVLRAMGPLDRIVQAAGRCNREGRLDRGRVVVFEPAEGKLPPGAYRVATEITRAMVGSGTLDPDSPADMRRYFEQLYATVSLDRRQIQQLRQSLNYPEIAQAFRMIDEETEEVVITTYGDEATRDQLARDLEQLRRQEGNARALLRRVQPFIVSLRVAVAQRYRAEGLIEELMPGLGRWHGRYDPVLGLVADDDRSQLVV
ncbi:MAG: hypothetical protein OHK0015_14720 [Chloroflexi bacterium OHK40]